MSRWQGMLVLALAGVSAVAAAEPAAKPVAIEFRAIKISVEQAIRVVPVLASGHADQRSFTDLIGMPEAGKAELSAVYAGLAQTGQRVAGSEVQEIKYPTEEWPFVAHHQTFDVPKEAPLTGVFLMADLLGKPGLGAITPQAWETRDVGVTFECETQLLENRGQILVNAVATIVRFVEFREFISDAAPNGIRGVQMRPTFEVRKTASSSCFESGKWQLLGSTLVDESKNVEVFIAKATLLSFP